MEPLAYIRQGNWLLSTCGRFQIGRMDLWHGRNYCAYDWFPVAGLPYLIDVAESADAAKLIIERYRETIV